MTDPVARPLRLPTHARPSLLALAALQVLGLGLIAAPAQAQSLRELYDVARGYDAAYLASQAQAQASRALVRAGVLAEVDRVLLLAQGQQQAEGPRDEVMARLRGGAPAGRPA